MSAHSPRPTDSGMTRRSLLRRGATVAGGAAVTVAVGDRLVPQYSPVGRAKALALTGTAVVAGMVVGAAGASLVYSNVKGDTDIDTSSVLEDEIYTAASAVADGRESFESEMQSQFLKSGETPYTNAAWSTIRAAVCSEIVNGNSNSEAEQAGLEALNQQTIRSITNIVERWNTGVNALAEQFVIDLEEDVGVLRPDVGLDYNATGTPYLDQQVDVSEVDGGDGTGYALEYLEESSFSDLPASAEDLEGRDEPLKVYGFFANTTAGLTVVHPFDDSTADGGDVLWGVETAPEARTKILQAHHSNLSNIDVLDSNLYRRVLASIEDSYQTITSDLSTYVESLATGLDQGAIDPEDILSPEDIVNQFEDSDAQARLGAELLAVGVEIPDEKGYRARITHEDIQTEDLWVDLYPNFSGEPIDISAGTTLEASDYEVAYIGYDSEANENYTTQILDSNGPLEILELDGVGDEQTIEDGNRSGSSGDDTSITVWTGDDPPEPIASPDDHAGWSIVVTGDSNTSTHSVTEVVENSGEYVLESTGLNAGESIQSIELQPGVEYNATSAHVSDPTQVDSEQTQQELEQMRQTVDDLEEALDDSDGGGGGDLFGGFFGGSLSDLAGGNLAGLAIIGVVVMAVVGYVTDMIPGVN